MEFNKETSQNSSQGFIFRPSNFGKSSEGNLDRSQLTTNVPPSTTDAHGEACKVNPVGGDTKTASSVFGGKHDGSQQTAFTFGQVKPLVPAFTPGQTCLFPSQSLVKKTFTWPSSGTTSTTSVSTFPSHVSSLANKPVFGLNTESELKGPKPGLGQAANFSFVEAYQKSRELTSPGVNSSRSSAKSEGNRSPLSKQSKVFDTEDTPRQRKSGGLPGTKPNLSQEHIPTVKKALISSAGKVAPSLRKSSDTKRSSTSLEKKLTSPEEIQKITSIVCTGIPEKLNNKEILHAHFSQFGKVKFLYCHPAKMRATLHFYDHFSAAAAKKNGTVIRKNYPPVEIFWRQGTVRKEMKPPKEVCDELLSLAELHEHNLLDRPLTTKHKQMKKVSEARPELEVKSSVPEIKGENLSTIITSAAANLADKLRILDARDKLLRMRFQKLANLNTATAKVGTCPDMCPEKERYSRIVKNTLASFEMGIKEEKTFDGEKVDDKLMIKEYSRSSADQEEPLPHELRPPQVLMQTMDHLVCNVMDKMDAVSSVADWYDFIWNRTRAIRKDITQQHLCDLPSALLVEKCARFHIHCASVLCQEDMATFDPKINNENLTKCLQTLKHLYHDLNLKGISCPNEVEFRCYDILLNLNEGDTLRQVQQFSSNILQSEEVRFALQVFSALNSNNYIKFFRLTRSASYLSACILHRYFTQVRIKAVQAILKSYGRPNNVEHFPVSNVTRFLAMESEQEGQAFIQWLGLSIETGSVVLDRSAFAIPTGVPPIPLKYMLVERKRACSVGEVVNGESLPVNPYPSYEPHNSFDSEGVLKSDAYDASDQTNKATTLSSRIVSNLLSTVQALIHRKERAETAVSGDIAAPKFLALSAKAHAEQHSVPVVLVKVPDVPSTLPDSSVFFSNEMENVAHDIILEVHDQIAREVCCEVMLLFSMHESIISDVCVSLAREISEEALHEETEALIKQKHAAEMEVAKSREKAILCFVNQILWEVIAEEVSSETRLVQEELKQEMLQALSFSFAHEIMLQVVDGEVNQIVFEVQSEAVLMLKASLEMKRKLDIARMKRAFTKWQEVCAKKRKLEYTRQTFPSAPLLSLDNRYGARKKMKISPEAAATVHRNHKKVVQLLNIGKIRSLLAKELAWSPLDLSYIIRNKIGEKVKAPNCWKLVISLPSQLPQLENRHQEDFSVVIDLLCSQFRKDENLDPGISAHTQVQTVSLYQMEMGMNSHPVSVCIKMAEGELDKSAYSWLIREKVIQGTSGVIFVLSEVSVILQYGFYSDRSRLKQLLLSKPSQPPIPLYILIIKPEESQLLSTEDVLFNLDVHSYQQAGLISSFQSTVIHVPYMYEDVAPQLEHVTTELLKDAPPAPNLTSAYLKDYIEDGLTTFVFNAVYQDLAHKLQHQVYYQSPQAIVALHNAAVYHLAKVAASPILKDFSWPAPEFKDLPHVSEPASITWNTKGNLALLMTTIENLCLPPLQPSHDIIGSVNECIAQTWHYVSVATHGVNQPMVALESRIQQMLHLALQRSEERRCAFYIPWTEIIYCISQFLLNCSNFFEADSGRELKVHYIHEDYLDFHQPQEWQEAVRESAWVQVALDEKEMEACECAISSHQVEMSQKVHSSAKQSLLPSVQSSNVERLLLTSETESATFLSKLEELLKEGELDYYAGALPGKEVEEMKKKRYSSPSKHSPPSVLSCDLERSLLTSKKESAAFLSKLEKLLKEGELDNFAGTQQSMGGKERKSVAGGTLLQSSTESPEDTLQLLQTEIEAQLKASALHSQTLHTLMDN